MSRHKEEKEGTFSIAWLLPAVISQVADREVSDIHPNQFTVPDAQGRALHMQGCLSEMSLKWVARWEDSVPP